MALLARAGAILHFRHKLTVFHVVSEGPADEDSFCLIIIAFKKGDYTQPVAARVAFILLKHDVCHVGPPI